MIQDLRKEEVWDLNRIKKKKEKLWCEQRITQDKVG